MYESVREALAGIYIPLIPYPFPGRSNESLHENQIEEREVWEIQQKNKKEKTEKGCTRVHKKIKEIQQQFLQAVTSGSRSDSGSGKEVFEFYNEHV